MKYQPSNPAPFPPQHLKVINQKRGLFVPSSCPIIASASASSAAPGYVSILESAWPRPTWVSQDCRIPIPVTPTSRVLLRTVGIVDSDCLDLDNEVSLFRALGGGPPSTPLSAVSFPAKITSQPLSEPSTTLLVSSQAPQPTVAARFPRKFAIDMQSGMHTLSLIKNDTSSLRTAFTAEFPGCSYVYQTVWNHVRAYREAVAHQFLDKYVKLGRTSGGKWSLLVDESKKLKKTGKLCMWIKIFVLKL